MPYPPVYFTYPEDDLVLSVADRLASMDDMEARIMSKTDPREAMMQSVRRSVDMGGIVLVCMIDGSPELVCGACRNELLSGNGQIWMLHTDEVERKQHRKFVKLSRIVLEALVQGSHCDYLDNWCLAENTRAIRWLQWLGFHFDRDMEINGHTWRHFYITTGDIYGSSGRA